MTRYTYSGKTKPPFRQVFALKITKRKNHTASMAELDNPNQLETPRQSRKDCSVLVFYQIHDDSHPIHDPLDFSQKTTARGPESVGLGKITGRRAFGLPHFAKHHAQATLHSGSGYHLNNHLFLLDLSRYLYIWHLKVTPQSHHLTEL